MARATLVGPDLEMGREVIRLLDEGDFPAKVVLYHFREEEGGWELSIASPPLRQIRTPCCIRPSAAGA